MNLRKKDLLVGLFLGSTALTMPSVVRAETPAPKFTDAIDDHSVDLTTGLPYFSMTEAGIGSGPGRVELQRIYAEGAGFIDNWSGGLYSVTANGVTKKYVQLAGMSDTFGGSGTTWTSDEANGATLTVDSNGAYTYTARDGTQILFDTTQTGDISNRSYNCPGADPSTCQGPISITKPSGLKFTFTWGSNFFCGQWCGNPTTVKRLEGVASSAGYSLSISYASNTFLVNGSVNPDWLKRTTATFGNSVTSPSPVPTINYAYPSSTEVDVTDQAGRTWVLTTDSNGNLTGIERPGSSSNNIMYAYGADGTVSSSTRDGVTDSYSRNGLIETRTDPLSHQRVVTADTSTGRPSSDKNELNNTKGYQYDSNARLTQITAPEGNYAQYAYDSRGNVTTTTLVPKSGSGLSDVVTSASYDSTCTYMVKCNKPNSTTDANGNVTTYAYDTTHGGVLSVTQPAPTTGAVQPQTRYSYTQITGANSDLVYLLTGISACQTTASCTGTADESKATIAYNSNLRPTSVTRSDGTGAVTATSAATYTATGDLNSVDGPLSGTSDTTKYRYDTVDRLIGVTSPSPGNGQPDRAIRITYRPDGQVSRKELGTVLSQSDADWANFSSLETLDVTFDTNSHPTQQQLSASGTAYALTQTNYDSLGRVDCTATRMNPAVYGSLPSSACTLSTQGSNGPDQITEAIYDNAGEMTQHKVAVGVTGQTATERTLVYNPNGTVASLTDANSNATGYTYDGFDRPITTTYPDATTEKVTSYDSNGNALTRSNRANQNTTFTYDALNRIVTKSPAGELQVTYAWDNIGRLTSASQTGTTLSYTYDALSRNLTQVGPQGTVTSTWDSGGRRTSVKYPPVTGVSDLTVSYNYITTGEVSSIADGATNLATYSYDALGNRTSVSFGNSTSQNYNFDAVSRLTTLSLAGLPAADNLTIGGSSTPISYNPAFQITSARRADAANLNTYSWPNYSVVTRNHTINLLNQVTQTSSSPGGTTTFGYDAKGNLTQSGSTYFCYDAENHLTASGSTSTCGTPTASLTYDPFGRLMQLSATATTKFAYDGLNMLAEYSGSSLTSRYVFGPNMDEPIVAYDSSSNRSWLYSDERGSIVATANSSAGILYTNRYDEYGAPALDANYNNLNSGRFQYTGQMWLPEVGLYYYKARLYSPTLGRFMQPDPIGYRGDGPNLYAYVRDDPVNKVDPFGLCIGGGGSAWDGNPDDPTVTCPRLDDPGSASGIGSSDGGSNDPGPRRGPPDNPEEQRRNACNTFPQAAKGAPVASSIAAASSTIAALADTTARIAAFVPGGQGVVAPAEGISLLAQLVEAGANGYIGYETGNYSAVEAQGAGFAAGLGFGYAGGKALNGIGLAGASKQQINQFAQAAGSLFDDGTQQVVCGR